MATWKKIITEGSDISELTNDSNYLTSVPSHSASLVTSGTFATARIADSAITTAKIASGAVDRFKLASGAVRAANLADEAVDTASIQNSVVTSDKLATGAVGHPSKLANNVVGNQAIDSSAVTATELAVSGNGSTSQFLRSDGDSTFTWATPTNTNTTYSLDITENNPDVTIGLNPSSGSTEHWNLTSEGSIQFSTNESTRETSVNITDEAITTARLDSNAVTNAKLATNAVTPVKANLGWHTQTKIFVAPSDFTINDDNQYGNLGMVDSGGQARVMYAQLEAYANIPIPSGYKVTHWRINGTASVSASANYSTIAIGTTTTAQVPQSQYTNTTNITNPSSGIAADDTNGRYFILGWHPTTVSQYLYGAILTIAKI